MKETIINKLKIFFNKAGFYVDRVPDKKTFYEKFQILEDNEIWYELKRYSNVLSIANNLILYDYILAVLIPKGNDELLIHNASFFGSGKGTNTLNSYRKVYSEDGVFFEKVYRTNSSDLKKMTWFYNEIYPYLNTEIIKTPALRKVIKGKVISAVYFDFVDFKTLSKSSMLFRAFEVIKHLMTLTHELKKTNTTLDFENGYQNMIVKFDDIYVKTARVYVEKEFKNHELFDKILQYLLSSNYFLAHGDLNSKNILGENYLIDWDSTGIYPIGMDMGKALNWFYLSNTISVNDVTQIIEDNFKDYFDSDVYNNFLLGSLFFCFLFRASEITFGKNDISSDVLNPFYRELVIQFNLLEIS